MNIKEYIEEQLTTTADKALAERTFQTMLSEEMLTEAPISSVGNLGTLPPELILPIIKEVNASVTGKEFVSFQPGRNPINARARAIYFEQNDKTISHGNPADYDPTLSEQATEGGNITGLTIMKIEDYTFPGVNRRLLKIPYTQEILKDYYGTENGNIMVREELSKGAAIDLAYSVDFDIVKAMDALIVEVDGVETKSIYDYAWADDGSDATATNPVRKLERLVYHVSGQIAKEARIGLANFLICTPENVAAVEAMEGFIPVAFETTSSVQLIGKLGSLKVYMDVLSQHPEDILIGVKSSTESFGAGLIYSPYDFIKVTDAYDIETLHNVDGVIMRYGITHTDRAKYMYKKITVSGLETNYPYFGAVI